MNIKPLADRILIQPDKAEEKKQGILLPSSVREKPLRGTIVAIGEGDGIKPMSTKVGDHVLYGRYAGIEVALEGTEYLIMREVDVFAIL